MSHAVADILTVEQSLRWQRQASAEGLLVADMGNMLCVGVLGLHCCNERGLMLLAV